MLVLESLGGTAAPSELSARSSRINLYSVAILLPGMIPRRHAFSIDLNRYLIRSEYERFTDGHALKTEMCIYIRF